MNIIYMDDTIDKDDLKKRTVRITGTLNDAMAHGVNKKLSYFKNNGKGKVTIHLNSTGGTVMDGLAIYDAIVDLRKACPVHIIASGSCMSMGVIVLQAATKRLSMPHTSFLLHELSMVNAGNLGAQKDQHEEALRIQDMLDKIVVERSGLSQKELKKLTEHRDYYMNADQALKAKLIDEVV